MSIYDEQPWKRLYPSDLSTDTTIEFGSALAMFQATAARLPDAPAIVYFDQPISFAEVDALSDALAVGLLDRGFGVGDRLAIYLQNVPQYLIAMLAAWKAGGISVSVNPMLKHKELRSLLSDSGAKALVTLESLWRDVAAEVIGETDVTIPITTSELDLVGDDVPELLASSQRLRAPGTIDLLELIEPHRGKQPPPAALEPDDIAMLTYTSGTTGPPKGAMNLHRNVVFNAQTFRNWGDLSERDVLFGVAPLFHVTGLIAHIALTFLTGMPIVLAFRFDPDVTLELMERHRVTFTIGSITVFTALMGAPSFDDRDLTSLRKVLSGGAPIAPSIEQTFEQRFGTRVHNVYGLTETTSPSHTVPRGLRAPVDEVSGALSVGLPVPGTSVRIVGDDGQEMPAGEAGEIVIGGPQVVPGYWNKPEESANALVDGELRTGDIGIMDADGWFFVVDRKKDMINASGYKVWPREVEDVLYDHDAVREAAVVGVPDEYRGETVRAFVSLRPGAEPVTESALITFCKERMAAYKYPREIVFLDEIPKTASGKILRRQLRDGGPPAPPAPPASPRAGAPR